MSYPQTQSTTSNYSHLYPQALQLKLYQAFIFSIPILFSIILFLLFYLFYLKRRFSPPPPPTLPRTLRIQPTHQFPPLNDQLRLKGNLKDKLSVILFDEDLRAGDSQCCVCLGEFEMKEELQQIPLCKHVFHQHCISHWLHSNSTCPLCRCPVISIAKHPLSHPLVIPDRPIAQEDLNFNPDQQMVSPDQGEQVIIVDTNLDNYYCSIEEHVVILVEGSSSTSTSR